MRSSISFRNSALQQADVLDGGGVSFYSGTRPLDADTALGGDNVLIAACLLSSPAMGAPAGATRAFNAISAAIVANNGAPTFARFFRSDGVTAVVDMNVPDEIVLSKSDWVTGEPFAGPSVTWTLPVGP